jgi:leucyl-tRNA synthetase
MDYNFREIEKKWQQAWASKKAYEVPNASGKPKYYVLDMFPYPSGAGLHVGHPLGYIASDIYARYKRLKGFNVLHPMGYDAFGLPAEQYAIEHGVHPAVSTEQNINNFRKQLDNIGFSFDWSREVRTSDPRYYKWTQWIFLQLFNSWYNRSTAKTEPIHELLKKFETEGNLAHPFPNSQYLVPASGMATFTAEEWNAFDEATQQAILMEYRIAYCGYGEVNWCEALGTVLANDEVVNGVSERGGYPVVKKKLRQWYLRITEYADRLLEGLQTVDFSEAMKEMQTNWIGKSSGAEVEFCLTPGPSPRGEGGEDSEITNYTNDSKKESGRYFKTADKTAWQTLKEFGKKNRKQPTKEENLLWQRLRNNQLGVKVRRQHTIHGYIVDFAIQEAHLVIEVDGEYHDALEQQQFDKARQNYLTECGYTMLRFTNAEVVNDTDGVLKKIKEAVQETKDNTKSSDTAPLLREEKGLGDEAIRVYTTRPDTIFGVDFMVLAPEHELVEQITTEEQKSAVDEYIAHVKSRSERERMAEKRISGVFTGAYVAHPFTEKLIPIWISEYVLAGYGTGAIMAVPAGDERDHKFAQHFGIPITNIFGEAYTSEEAVTSKDVTLHNSDFLNGLKPKEAAEIVIQKLEELGIGTRKVNYKMRDAAFSRQRYWGEPFPIVWKRGIAYPLDEQDLPLELPHVESYKPGPEGEGPLANIPEWNMRNLETNTMPGYAGSSWYFLRYMDPHNNETFCDKKVSAYWNQVDLYVGGTEHAVGHLLYSRMWTKALYDLGFITFDEPFKKLLNQGMITGKSFDIGRLTLLRPENGEGTILYRKYISEDKIDDKEAEIVKLYNYPIGRRLTWNRLFYSHKFVDSRNRLYEENLDELLHLNKAFVQMMDFDKSAIDWEYDKELEKKFIVLKLDIEKMSKSKFNVENPDDIVEKYGADTFRMYEMFLGPVEMSKPWDTKGIEGVHRFLKKLWRLFWNENTWIITTDKATAQELKVLHKSIKKIEEDTERFSFNTAVSAFMVCVNELTDLKSHKQEILEPLLILLAPYAPHIAEELYHQLRHSPTTAPLERGPGIAVLNAVFPKWEEKHLVESSKDYPVSINGKMRTQINIALDAPQSEVEKLVLANDVVQKWTEGKPVKKFIFVPGKMVNVVV